MDPQILLQLSECHSVTFTHLFGISSPFLLFPSLAGSHCLLFLSSGIGSAMKVGPHRSNPRIQKRGEGKINIHLTPCQQLSQGCISGRREKPNQGCASFVLKVRLPPLAIFWGDFMMKTQHGEADPSDLWGVLLQGGLFTWPDWAVLRRRAWRGGKRSWQGTGNRCCKTPSVQAPKGHLIPGFGAQDGDSRCLYCPQSAATVTNPISSVLTPKEQDGSSWMRLCRAFAHN